MKGSIKVRLKGDPVIIHLAQSGKTKHLIATAVCQNGSIPGSEAMKSSQLCDDLMAWTKIEMIGIRQNDLGPELLKIPRSDGLDGTDCPDRDEDGRLDHAMRRPKLSCPSKGLRFLMTNRKLHLKLISHRLRGRHPQNV